jgi:hypothetical protein
MSGNFEVTRVTIEFSVPSASGSEKLKLSFAKGHLPNSIFFSERDTTGAGIPKPGGRPVREAIKSISEMQQRMPQGSAAETPGFMLFHDGYCDWWFLQ